MNRNSALTAADVDHLFLCHKHNREVPFRPKGGDIYVFKPDNAFELNNWVADGHSFSSEGNRKA